MTEPNEIEFSERVRRPFLSGTAARSGIVLGSALLFVVGAIAVMGASPSPSAPTAADPSAGASSAPAASGAPRDHNGGPGFGFGGFGFGRGGLGFGEITITAISGSDLSLKTADGWTRTITVTADTTITRAGTAITVADLEVGDEIRFAQTRNADGTYTVTKIQLVIPSVAGQVTAVDGSTITVKRLDGTTETIHVDASTTYTVAGVTTPTLSDIKVGAFIVAQGTQRADGSLDAAAVHSGFEKRLRAARRRSERARRPRQGRPERGAIRHAWLTRGRSTTGHRAAPSRRDDPPGSSRRDSQRRLTERGFHGGDTRCPARHDWRSRDDRRPLSHGPRGRARRSHPRRARHTRSHLGPRSRLDPARGTASVRSARVGPRDLPVVGRPGIRFDRRHRGRGGLERRIRRGVAPATANAVPAGVTANQGPTDITAVVAAATPSVVTITSETEARRRALAVRGPVDRRRLGRDPHRRRLHPDQRATSSPTLVARPSTFEDGTAFRATVVES